MTIDRRSWLMGAAAATAGALVAPARASASRRKLRPSDRVNLAVIGAGGMGAENMAKLTSQNIVALADPDFGHVARAFQAKDGSPIAARLPLRAAYDKAARFNDYRRMLDARRDLDAVVIATPDQHHAVAAKLAMERGLHVYVQKPLTYTVREARVLNGIARADPRLVTQMGNQGHSGDDGRRIVEIVRGGAIGDVREVELWTNRPIWPQGVARPAPVPVPAGFDWDVWMGPSEAGWGYNPLYAHFNWRGWVPFGSGAIGDMGAHLIDFPVWALELGLPTRVETRHSAWGGGGPPDMARDGGPPDGASGGDARGAYPLATITTFRFGQARGGPVTLTWYDGGLMPPTPDGLAAGAAMNPEGGVLFKGSRGMLMHGTYGEKPILIGDGAADRARAIPQSLPRVPDGLHGHEMNWIRAIRGEEPASSPFADAAPLTETMLLGIVALHAGEPIDYDGAAGRITNLPDANRLLDRTYRKGWEL